MSTSPEERRMRAIRETVERLDELLQGSEYGQGDFFMVIKLDGGKCHIKGPFKQAIKSAKI